MFQFRRFPTHTYLIQYALLEYCSSGFPHSEISGSMLICSSPKLIAACHVLHRLLMPRHSPCALISLIFLSQSNNWFSNKRLLELCRLKNWFLSNCSMNYPLFESFPHKNCLNLNEIQPLLLLARNTKNLHCSVFKVQLPVSFKTRIQSFNFSKD